MLHLDLDSRRLEGADLPALIALSAAQGWGYGEIYWRVILSSCTGFGVFDGVGKLIGCTFIADYGSNRGNIGAVIVDTAHRGQGLASFMMNQAEDFIGEGKGIITLIATEDGLPVYRRRGYEITAACSQMIRWSGAERSPMPNLPGYRFSPITDEALPEMAALDRQAFGANRSHILFALQKAAEKTVALYEAASGRLAGFGILYRRADMMKLGPIVAGTNEEAVAIVQMLIYGMGETVRIDILSHQPDFKEAVMTFGFQENCIDPVMTLRGGSEITARPHLFAIGAQSIG